MTDAPDLDKLARRYLDLWQDQVSALASDPALADAMAKTYTMMVRGMAAFAAATGVPVSHRQTGANEPQPAAPAKTAAPPTPGAPPAAPSPPGSSVDAAELKRRVAELEDRLARLEAAFAAGREGSRTTSRRRRS